MTNCKHIYKVTNTSRHKKCMKCGEVKKKSNYPELPVSSLQDKQ